MSSELAPRSSYLTTGLGKAEVYEVQDMARSSAMVTEIAKIANHEVARVGAHAVGTMADLVQGATHVNHRLIKGGCRHPIFPEAQDKILQVTGQNIITMANTAQQQILRQAVTHMP